MSLHDMASPDTAAAVAANQVARRYCSSALYAHSVRSYLWGVAYAEREGLDFDGELFYVAAMLHDVGLTRPFDAHQMPFEEAGGQVAWVFAAAAGWPDDRRNRVAQVIEKHMWPSVDPHEDVEGHLLEVATSIDISGRGLHLIPHRPPDRRRRGLAAPRPGSRVHRVPRAQGERKPTSRAADLTRGGLADALRDHPHEPKRGASRPHDAPPAPLPAPPRSTMTQSVTVGPRHGATCSYLRLLASSSAGMTGLMSTTGVPLTASRGWTRSLSPSFATIVARCRPTGLGRAGERVLNTPRSGPVGSSPGRVASSSRRAWCSQVSTKMSEPTWRSRMPSRTSGLITSQASGAPW